jgi:hypothetical protein
MNTCLECLHLKELQCEYNLNPAGDCEQYKPVATRNSSEDKFDYEGFLSPLVLERYAEYMHKHKKREDGSYRASDNWQNGLPPHKTVKSLIRHMMALWKMNRFNDYEMEEELCGVIFNAMSMLNEIVKERLGIVSYFDPLSGLVRHKSSCGGEE